MKKVVLSVFAVPFILAPAVILAQSGMKPTAATYISVSIRKNELSSPHLSDIFL